MFAGSQVRELALQRLLRVLLVRRFCSHDPNSVPVLGCVGSVPQGPAVTSPRRKRVEKLKDIQMKVYRGELVRDPSYVKVIGHEVCDMIYSGASMDSATLNNIGKVLRLFGFYPEPYDQDFFDAVADALLNTQDENILNGLLPSFMWICSRRQYYPAPLFSHAGSHVLSNMRQFTSPDINMMVHAFAKCNHHVPGLIDQIEQWFFANETLDYRNHLPWTLAWSGMVFAEYPKEMLMAILSDDYIEGCVRCNSGFMLFLLLQLRISLNFECADLKLGLGWDTEQDIGQWGKCRPAMKGVGTDVMRRAYHDKLKSYSTLKRSVFGSNIHRAIRTALGTTLMQSDAISLSGYVIDFEVLLDKHGEPIECPMQWKYRSLETLASSLGIEEKGRAQRGRHETISNNLVETMKESEKDHADNCEGTTSIDRYEREVPFNLASDWGRKFHPPPRQPARKLVIEGDGIYHFARNDRTHQLGGSVLKKRHLESLGWKMITVDYKVWHELQNGDAQANYIKSLIYPPTPNFNS